MDDMNLMEEVLANGVLMKDATKADLEASAAHYKREAKMARAAYEKTMLSVALIDRRAAQQE